MWARCNLLPSSENGFAESPREYPAGFSSFGNSDSHEPTSGTSFAPYTFGTSTEGEPYVSSEGAQIGPGAIVPIEQDVARHVCGYPWRSPSLSEFQELFDNCDFIDANGDVIPSEQADKLVEMPDAEGSGTIVCIRLRSRINGAVIIFPACGRAEGVNLQGQGDTVYYWTATSAGNLLEALTLRALHSGIVVGGFTQRYVGCAIRPVW